MQLKPTAVTSETLARLAVPANALLIILLAYSLARLSWSWLLPWPAPAPPFAVQAATDTLTPLAEDKKAKLATITNWHLFGETEVATPAPTAPPRPQAAPETKLNLKLVGIFASENRNFALAIISESSGLECPVRVGEPIRDKSCKPLPNGPRLEQIFPDKVILSRGGSLETLSLPRESLGSAKPSAPAVPPPPLIMPAPADRAPPSEPGDIPTSSVPAPSNPLAGGATAAPEIIDASAVGERLRSKGPEALQELITARPYMPNRQLQGFSLNPTRGHEELFRQLGLQTGDILVQFNGVPLTDQSQGMTVMQELLTSKQVDLRILRSGTERALTLILRAP